MKQKLLFTLMFLMTWGTGIVLAQTNATSITSGSYYRIYSPNNTANNQGRCIVYDYNGSNPTTTNAWNFYTTGDDRDVWQLEEGSDDSATNDFTMKNVVSSKYIKLTTDGSSSMVNDAQNLYFTWYTYAPTDTYNGSLDYKGEAWAVANSSSANISDKSWLNINASKSANTAARAGVWTLNSGGAVYFYPMSKYTLTVTGETGKSVTITAKNHSSAAANKGTLYIDDSAVLGDLEATTNEGYTATVTAFDTSNKTITVNVSANRIVGTYKLKTTFSETDYYFSLPTLEGSSPVLTTSEATVELVECGTGYMLRNSSGYYLAYKGGNDYDLIATTTVANAAVLTVAISGTTMTLLSQSKNLYLCVNYNSLPSNIYGDGNLSAASHRTYWAYQWTIEEFTDATTYTRVFEAAQTYPVCLPMAVTTSSVSNGKFYELTSYSDNTLHFHEVSGTTTAYKPYLFVTSAAGIVLSGDITAYSSQDLTTSVSGASMIGTIGSQTLVSGTNTYYGYRASDGIFVQVGSTTGAHIGAYRAYIQIPGSVGVKAFNVVLDDATGIETVNGEGLRENGSEAYDLQGRRVLQPRKGLYIVNGKKVIIK